jgi:gamma-glutamyltranspeptidase
MMRAYLGVWAISLLAGGSWGNPTQNALVANHGTKAAVASESMICSQIGIDLIKAGVST